MITKKKIILLAFVFLLSACSTHNMTIENKMLLGIWMQNNNTVEFCKNGRVRYRTIHPQKDIKPIFTEGNFFCHGDSLEIQYSSNCAINFKSYIIQKLTNDTLYLELLNSRLEWLSKHQTEIIETNKIEIYTR